MRWIKIASLEEIYKQLQDDSSMLIRINAKRICVSKFRQELYAFDDACPHLNEGLSGGHVNSQGEIVCPLHHYRFSLVTGHECEQRTAGLVRYPIKVEQAYVFIGLT